VGLWDAIERLRADDRVPALRIRLVGTVDPNVHRSLRARGLSSITEHVSYVPHAEAVALMRQAGLLLLTIEDFPQAEGMMTGKIYEYLASGRPVLGVGPPDGDAAALLRRTDGGRLFGRDDVSGLAEYIQTHYEAWVDGTPQPGASPGAVRPYRRRAQTEQMATELDTSLRREEDGWGGKPATRGRFGPTGAAVDHASDSLVFSREPQ
jgi:hypothetical protein